MSEIHFVGAHSGTIHVLTHDRDEVKRAVKSITSGDLVVPPLARPFWHLELTPDRSILVGTAVHLQVKGPKDPPKFQMWNYPALCQAAGLEY